MRRARSPARWSTSTRRPATSPSRAAARPGAVRHRRLAASPRSWACCATTSTSSHDVVARALAPPPRRRRHLRRASCASWAAAGRIRLVERHTDTDGMLGTADLDDAGARLARARDLGLRPDRPARRLRGSTGPTPASPTAAHRALPPGRHRRRRGRHRHLRHASGTAVEADGATPILDAGEAAGVLMPSGCRMGICFGCVVPAARGCRARPAQRRPHHRRPGRRHPHPDLRVGGRRRLRDRPLRRRHDCHCRDVRPHDRRFRCLHPEGARRALGAPRSTNTRLSTAIAERRHVPKRSGKPDPTAHLTAEDIEALGRELDAMRQEVLDSRGASDAAYIRKVIDVQRKLELGSRAVLLVLASSRRPGSSAPPACRVAKILDNMEIGHNVLHGQWDWMRDPKIHSTDLGVGQRHPGRAVEAQPQRAAPHLHQRDRQGQRPRLRHHARRRGPALDPGLPRPAALELPQRVLLRVRHRGLRPRARQARSRGKRRQGASSSANGKQGAAQDPAARRRKDYVRAPAAVRPVVPATPSPPTPTANFVRNVWTHSVIMCGHFPEGVETFARASIEGETRGEWYLRQMLGSANISGSKAMHLMTGNLSPPDRAPPVPRPAEQPLRARSRRRSRRSASATA